MNASDKASAAPVRTRRTHAARTAETRARIIGAVVECIAEVGFGRTTAAEICRRAGVTWGAVQHHFGGKDGILLAVLEDSFGRFAERLADVEIESTSLDERVDLFIERAWEHFGSPHFQSTFEILLSYAGAEGPESDMLWQTEMFKQWNRIWNRLFADAELARRDTVTLQYYTISVLSGLAAMRMVRGRPGRKPAAELALIKQTLTRELGQKDGRTP
jgi:AcrR family transcriptional regulator